MIALLIVSCTLSVAFLLVGMFASCDTLTSLCRKASDTWWWARENKDDWDRMIAANVKVRVRVVGASAVIDVSLPWTPWFQIKKGMSEEDAVTMATRIANNLDVFVKEKREEKIITVTPDGDSK